jgi:hypothetical protein
MRVGCMGHYSMIERSISTETKRHVQRTLRQFFSDPLKRRHSRRSLVKKISSLDGEFVVFGGVLRDLLHRRTGYMDVHDVDIVYDGLDEQDVLNALTDFNVRKNRFGGIKIEQDGNVFDLWRLQDTWAFQNYPEGPWSLRLEDLVLTTQLSVEAIVVYVKHSSRNGRQVITAPIFDESIAERCLEINFEPNPNPAATVVRALVTADKLQYCIGPLLAKYINKISFKYNKDSFTNYFSQRYPMSEMSKTTLLRRLDIVVQHVESGKPGPVRLPFLGQQLLFDQDER